MIVVADLHRLKNRKNEVYQLDGTKELERKGMRVEQSYVDQTNGNSKVSGKLFIVDEEATKEWLVENAKSTEAHKLRAEKEKIGLTEQAEALIEKSKPKKARRTKAQIEADKEAGKE